MRIDEVECPECGGEGAIEEAECPVCDGHGSVEGEVRTISLHNIRYETRWNGDELWLSYHEGELLVGSVARSADGGRWEIRAAGFTVAAFKDLETARRVFEASVLRMEERVIDLT